MVLTVTEIYEIANNMFNSEHFKKEFSYIKYDFPNIEEFLSYKEFIIYNLQHTGETFSLFANSSLEGIFLSEKNGRIYFEIAKNYNQEPIYEGYITNDILFKFPLSIYGEEFVRKFI